MMKRIACIHWSSVDGKSPLERCELQIAERCGRFSPIVGFDSADRHNVFLDISGLAHLFGGETAMAAAIVRDLAQFGYMVRAAVADTIGAAWAAVHYCDGDSAISNLQSSAFLHSLPIEALRLPTETVRLLHELGLVRIGQLESLPREEFLSRFGAVLLRRMDQAFGRLDEPAPACPLPPKFEAGWLAEHPSARRETIAAAVEWLIARVAAMLARCGRGALRLDCRLFLEINNQQSTIDNLPLSVGLFQPTADAKRLFDLVQLQLERVRIGSAVTAIEVAASLSAALEPRKQAMLFELEGGAGKGDRHRFRPEGISEKTVPGTFSRLAGLVERLCSRLGSGAVVGVRLRPEAQPELAWRYEPLVGGRRRRVPTDCRRRLPTAMQRCKDRKSATGVASYSSNRLPELPPRPLRLLPRPLAAAVTSIAPDGPPLRFRLDGFEHEVARSWGPERIETGWWRGRAVGRDYFRVETACGGRFWFFRRLRDGKWFLHGTFE
jgi:protein ImuB